MNQLRFRDIGIALHSELGEGHFLAPDTLMDIMNLAEEDDERRPFLPLTFDTLQELSCWCSPPPQDQTGEGEFVDAVLVVTEKSGLVHVLHPMI